MHVRNRKQNEPEGLDMNAPTATHDRFARLLSAATRPMTLRREVVRQPSAFDRQLPSVKRFTVLSLPR
jgi:hypothetical protein